MSCWSATAALLVTMTGEEIPGGWVAISRGMVDAVGGPGTAPEAAGRPSAPAAASSPPA